MSRKKKLRLDPFERALLQAVQNEAEGNPTGRAALETHFADPDVVERFGNLARVAERSLTSAICSRDPITRAALVRKLPVLRAELAGPAPTPLELLLVDRIVVTWMQLYYATNYVVDPFDQPQPSAEFVQRWQSRAQQRFTSAIHALATVRKLLRPAPSLVDMAMQTVPETSARRPASQRPAPAPIAADAYPVVN